MLDLAPEDELKLLIKLQDWLTERIKTAKAIPAFLPLANRSFAGECLVLDFGGSNLRCNRVRFLGDGSYEMLVSRKRLIPHDCAEAGELFAILADLVIDCAGKELLAPGQAIPLAHVFSFPTHQTGINQATLLRWTKELQISGVEGKDVQLLLGTALRERGAGSITPRVILNDTVAALMAGSYQDTSCGFGMVAGTGFNMAAYLETAGKKPMAFNLECGDFSNIPENILLSGDRRLDQESAEPGQQRYEKMIGGRYLGELFRLQLPVILGERALSLGDSPVRGQIDGAVLAAIASGEQDPLIAAAFPAFRGERKKMQEAARELARGIFYRAGILAALPPVALHRSGYVDPVYRVVCVEGSLFTKVAIFQQAMCQTLIRHGLAALPPQEAAVSLGGGVAAFSCW